MGFLVLNRDESAGVVCILPDGSEIVIQVNEVRGKKVSLSFMAPASVKVLRRESCMRTGKEYWERVETRGWFYLDFRHQGRLQLARVQLSPLRVSMDLTQMERDRAKHLLTQAVAVASIRIRKRRNATKWLRITKQSVVSSS